MQLMETSRAKRDSQEVVAGLRQATRHAFERMLLLLVALVFVSAQSLQAQGRVAATSLLLRVAPQEQMELQGDALAVKIRLARGTTARLWMANACTSPSSESQVITASGAYTIPLNTMTEVSSGPNGSTAQVCLMSSDGMLSDSRPVQLMASGNSAREQQQSHLATIGGSTVLAPEGWTVTAQAAITTSSNP